MDITNQTLRDDTFDLCYAFLYIAVIILVLETVRISIFSYIAESLGCRLRIILFEKLLKMHMGFFDLPQNAPGNLSSRLAEDVNHV